MEPKTVLILLAVLAGLVLILFLLSYFSKGKRKGRAAERKVSKALHKIGKKDNIRIINNAYLPLYAKACEIDHLVFGKFGILVVETKGISGTVAGKGKNLTHVIGTKTHKFYNPQMQNKTHIDNVIHHLKKGGFNNVPVEGVVVFSANDITFPRELGVDLKGLEKVYRLLPDAKCNPDVLYDYFDGIRIKSPIKKLFVRIRKKND